MSPGQGAPIFETTAYRAVDTVTSSFHEWLWGPLLLLPCLCTWLPMLVCSYLDLDEIGMLFQLSLVGGQAITFLYHQIISDPSSWSCDLPYLTKRLSVDTRIALVDFEMGHSRLFLALNIVTCSGRLIWKKGMREIWWGWEDDMTTEAETHGPQTKERDSHPKLEEAKKQQTFPRTSEPAIFISWF